MSLAAEPLSSGQEPIPGYVLRERIGAGGFGEVWSVEAPGGLEKAIKLVFGTMDSDRAQRELRSLERLRRVHHPFLLTLERFEVIGNRLMIVTERADEGLDQIVSRYHKQGIPGIPREELIGYLGEAADALDYMREKYGLQHLDIKPANLLVLSGHVKVADFGLVKDLRDNDHSMVGGLTPTYAAPEVFDGKPSVHSDQYSLAIVYQELLTGQRPFSGRTIAQLATQHVHSPPDLSSLPSAERPIIARALEKRPDRRFSSCAELMRRLRDCNAKPIEVPSDYSPCEPAEDTMLGGPAGKAAAVKDLAGPIQTTGTEQGIGTALVIGLGGVGADVLAKAKSHCFTRQAPNLRCLLIDTDPERLEQACTATRGSERLLADQTLHLPIKTPHEYREAGARLGAISRRWIYNVPRSGRTEGLRPIGRLALVDHSAKVTNRIKSEIQALPRDASGIVYVVGSLAGGTASGMVWDIVHVVRSLLDEANRADIKVRPLIATAWQDCDRCGSLQFASSLAAMQEATYYANAENSYPGDIHCGFAPVPAGRSPLKDMYLIAPRDDQRAADLLADYLIVNLSPVGKALEASRTAKEDSTIQFNVRSAGSVTITYEGIPGFDRMMHDAIYRSIRQIVGKTRANESLVNSTIDALLKLTQTHPTLWAERWLAARGLSRGPAIMKELSQFLLASLPGEHTEQTDWSGSMLMQACDHVMSQLVGGVTMFTVDPSVVSGQIMSGIQKRLINSQIDFVNALEVLRGIEGHLKRIASEQQQEEAKLANDIREISGTLRMHSALNIMQVVQVDSPMMKWVFANVRLAIAAELAECAERTASLIHEATIEFTEQARRMAAILTICRPETDTGLGISLISQNTVAGQEKCDGTSTEALYQASVLVLESVRRFVVKEALAEDPQESLAELERLAQDAFSVAGLERPNESSYQKLEEQLQVSLKQCRPPLLDCGGEQRRLLFVGDADQQKYLEPLIEKVAQGPVTTVIVAGTSPVFVHEAQNIVVESAMARLVTALGPEEHLINRLVTRAGSVPS